MTTGSATDVSSAGATLQGSFTGATGRINVAGFVYGTSADALDATAYDDNAVGSITSSSLSATITSLAASTTYYYKAFVGEYNESTQEVEYRYGGLMSFTTAAAEAVTVSGWLELPATTGSEDYVGTFYSSGTSGANRNYSYNYSYEYYASLWVAYPLCSSHTSGSANSTTWNYNPDIEKAYQVNVESNSYGTNYGASTYSRGHQIPAADRKCNATMRSQTYYLTNQTPQIQTGFNGSIWGNLETATRNLLSSTDTIYVVTGAAYRKVGGSETISYLTAAKTGITPESVPVPNYYWKALLKVERDSDGAITAASAIGFWFDHKVYSNSDYSSCAVSVKQIEEWTGFSLFSALPSNSGITTSAKSNTSWTTFQNF